MPAGRWLEVCRRCGVAVPLGLAGWECTCGGLYDLQGPAVDPLPAASGRWSMWRYRSALPDRDDGSRWENVTLGEGLTPLVPVQAEVWCKCDYVMPTGSFKDRGTAVMLSVAASVGVDRLVTDSSGNAGRSAAAYAARAGMAAQVFVPAGTAPAKVAAMETFGATVTIGGDRQQAASAARAAAGPARESGAWYASHVYRPAFVHGVKTLAFELYEQLGGPPGTVVVPAGNGTLVLGLWLGFRQLQAAGRLGQLPSIVAVQAERCAPLLGLQPTGPTAATGIAIPNPRRAGEVRAAIQASAGTVLVATEDEIQRARTELAAMGFGVEATGAVAWTPWLRGAGPVPGARMPVVVVLTGAA
jgi:threonine synthase